jgi:hypothetical protein
MEPVSRRTFFAFLEVIFLPVVCSVFVSTHIQAGEHPSLLLAVAAPTEPFSPPIGWVDDLEQRLKTYFTKKYPAYDFSPYEQELEHIRNAASHGDRWGAKRETGVFLKMLGAHAYGLGDDAAEELTAISNRIMPEEEFGIIYPGSRSELSTNGASKY